MIASLSNFASARNSPLTDGEIVSGLKLNGENKTLLLAEEINLNNRRCNSFEMTETLNDLISLANFVNCFPANWSPVRPAKRKHLNLLTSAQMFNVFIIYLKGLMSQIPPPTLMSFHGSIDRDFSIFAAQVVAFKSKVKVVDTFNRRAFVWGQYKLENEKRKAILFSLSFQCIRENSIRRSFIAHLLLPA